MKWTTAEFWFRAAHVIDRLGQNDFYDRLLALLGLAAPHDLAALVRYSRSSPPDLIIPRIEPTDAILSYYTDYYILDPFFTHWASGGEVGVYRLRALARGIGRTRYAREFLSTMAIYDEIAVFLPPLGDGCPTLLLDRRDGPFSAIEVARVHSLFPFLAALHRRHLSMLMTTGMDLSSSPLGNERPLRLIDHHGKQIFATPAWTAATAKNNQPLIDAIAIISTRGPCTMRMPGSVTLSRTQLASDFGPAPGGFCDEISTTRQTENGLIEKGLPTEMADRLSEREAEVVLLTLQGYPIIEIARKLGLSRGTIKNYRLNIYRKFDITTERELFGEYIRAVNGQS